MARKRFSSESVTIVTTRLRLTTPTGREGRPVCRAGRGLEALLLTDGLPFDCHFQIAGKVIAVSLDLGES